MKISAHLYPRINNRIMNIDRKAPTLTNMLLFRNSGMTVLNCLSTCAYGNANISDNLCFLLRESCKLLPSLFKSPLCNEKPKLELVSISGANILRGVSSAGVLAGFDKFKEIYIAWRLG